MRWAAMLRGVNLGKRQLKSEALKGVATSLGFGRLKTLLASGNVVFDADARPARWRPCFNRRSPSSSVCARTCSYATVKR